MEIEKYLISFLIFILIVATGSLMITDLNTSYDNVPGYHEIQGGIANDMEDNKTIVQGITSNMEGLIITQQISEETTEGDMFRGGYSALRSLYQTRQIFQDIIQTIGQYVGIPAIFIDIGVTIVVILIVTSVIYMIFRFQPR